MSVVWGNFDPLDLVDPESLAGLPRKEARALFQRRMELREHRRSVLGKLLAANGVALGERDEDVAALNGWFANEVEPDPEIPGRPSREWRWVGQDIALFLGDVMVRRNPALHWAFFTWGTKNVSYQQHVVMGFTTEDPKMHTNINIDRGVSAYAHRLVESRGSIPTYGTVEIRGARIDVGAVAEDHCGENVSPDIFLRWLRNAAERA